MTYMVKNIIGGAEKMAKVISLVNQKGGVGKTHATFNLGAGLVRAGKKVLCIDCDSQGSLTASMGYSNPDSMSVTLSTLLTKVLEEKNMECDEGILKHREGVDLIPANIELSGVEVSLVNTLSREIVLRDYINRLKPYYDYILLDCSPSLGMITINALVASDSVIIPVQTHFLSLKGLEQLLKTINKVKRQINPGLNIDGILLTMVDNRTNFAKEIATLLRENYGNNLRIFKDEIPLSIRAAEASAEGKSMYDYDPKGKVAFAYKGFTKEVLNIEKSRRKNKDDFIR